MDERIKQQMIKETQTAVSQFANVARQSIGKTTSAFWRGLTEAFLEEDHPDRLFFTWLDDNVGRLREAVAELGLQMPEAGPGFAKRLMDAVVPKLKKE